MQKRMALVVQKFGGTSVGSIERIQHVARWALESQARGDQVVLVVSAMSGETNRLVGLAQQINPVPYSREYDMLIASGEQVACGLVSLAINTLAGSRAGSGGSSTEKARPLLGHQIGILTDSVFSKARIQKIDTRLLESLIARGIIPVIAGFQGVDAEQNITTLGRGGSDTSAVAIAAALKADDCEIYTDVDGVYTTDPRLCPGARKVDRISYEEMMELASLGAKVLQIRSVELAAKYKVPLHVRSSFSPVEGTRVVSMEEMARHMKESSMEKVVVVGVAADPAQVKFRLQGLGDRPDAAARVFNALAKAAIVVDVIVQDTAQSSGEQGQLNLSFTVGESDRLLVRDVLQRLGEVGTVVEDPGLAKVSVVGVGMQHHPGVASRMFGLLAEAGIRIRLISTSEIKISCLIDGDKMKAAVQALHQGFGLED